MLSSETVSAYSRLVLENHQAVIFDPLFKRSSSLKFHKKRPAFLRQALKEIETVLLLSWCRVPPGDPTPVSKAACIPAERS
jgi:hypothetical protein